MMGKEVKGYIKRGGGEGVKCAKKVEGSSTGQ
jgi:hypothetical protein